MADTAQKRWELENSIPAVDTADIEALYKWDDAEQRDMQNRRPWNGNPNYFKR